jgi:hypothetical protein
MPPTPLPHPSRIIPDMDEHDEFPPIHRGGLLMGLIDVGTVVDRWDCPSCDRTIDVIHRPGRPRLYCSQACRQRAYRWRRRNRAHTVGTRDTRPEGARARSYDRGTHALRAAADPLSQRRDRRDREVTVCGLLARPFRLGPYRPGVPFPFALPHSSTCRTCEALIQPRPLGLVPPDAMPPPWRWEFDRRPARPPDSPTRGRRR